MALKKYIITVNEIIKPKNDIRIIKFVFEGLNEFEFYPGAFVMLWKEGYVDVNGNLIRRAYSIASASTNKEYLEICFKIEDLGAFSSKVNGLDVGDQLNMQGPFNGHFILKDEHDPVFVVAGTGIAPIMSMLRTKPFHSTLIYGIKTDEGYLYKDELADYKNLKKIICVSRQNDTKFLKGRITKEILKENLKDLNKDVFICGPQEMVNNTSAYLKEIGFAESKIHIDKWG